MSQSPQSPVIRRYRINPVESGILAAVSLLMLNSLYSLVYRYDDIRVAVAKVPERALASTAPLEVGLDCAANPSQGAITVAAASVRLTGMPCQAPEHLNVQDPTFRAVATQTGTPSQIDVEAHEGTAPHFTTGTLALEPGANSIQLEFSYPDGTRYQRTVQITRK